MFAGHECANPEDSLLCLGDEVDLRGANARFNAIALDHDRIDSARSGASRAIDGFQSPFGMELLATVDWLVETENVERTHAQATQAPRGTCDADSILFVQPQPDANSLDTYDYRAGLSDIILPLVVSPVMGSWIVAAAFASTTGWR